MWYTMPELKPHQLPVRKTHPSNAHSEPGQCPVLTITPSWQITTTGRTREEVPRALRGPLMTGAAGKGEWRGEKLQREGRGAPAGQGLLRLQWFLLFSLLNRSASITPGITCEGTW